MSNETNRTGLEQELSGGHAAGKLAVEEIVPLIRAAGAEGIVLLKNQNDTLPVTGKDKVSVFGRCALDYFTVGYGSGGDVRRPYDLNLMEGLRGSSVNINEELADVYEKWTGSPKNKIDHNAWSWGNWPRNFPEMPLSEEIVETASKKSDIALIVIGRAAGEDRENLLEKGSYYLTDEELDMMRRVARHFKRVAVILDCGNIIDMAWTKEFEDSIGAIVCAWQGGMESGHAVADVLTGRVNPCGKLPCAIADAYSSYPSANDFGDSIFNNYIEDIYVGYRYFETFAPQKVLYPFGFGLSYTTFSIGASASAEGTVVTVKATVRNTGDREGKEVVQVYLSAPQGLLGKPARELAAFAKTSLLKAGESETLTLTFDLASLASYDDAGVTGNKSAFVLEAGEYTVYIGGDVRNADKVFTVELTETVVTQQLREVMAVKPENRFERLVNRGGQPAYEPVPTVTTDLKQIILDGLPKDIPQTGDKGIKFEDVKEGGCTMEQFVAQLSLQELDDISHGEGEMNSKLGTEGNAGAFGGVSKSLRQKGIWPVITADGPSGVRIWKTCALLPCGTALACTFDTQLVTRIYALIGAEMRHHGVNILLAPGMNIHRNPLCGRNFEYFSEDPLLSGKMGAAVVNGVQSAGVSACPKHFACNNQETSRDRHDARISERANREIYLKTFEIMVKESGTHAIMTSYNKINGVWSHYNYELCTTVLREEWGFDGVIITDWWMRAGESHEFPGLTNDAYRVRAQVDVLMPGEDNPHKNSKIGRHLLKTHGKPEGITLGEMQRVAMNVLRFMQKISGSRKT